jgi:hypothetical protein
MSGIRFVDQLGDALEAAATEHLAGQTTRRTRWWRLPRRRSRVIAGLALLALTGGAVAATQQSSVTLVAGGIACYGGTGTGAASEYFDVEANGRSPQAACAAVFASDGPAALGAPGARLEACADPHGYVAVFEANGSDDQCRQLGLMPFQAASYAAAQSTVDQLVAALSKLGANRTCIPVGTLSADVQDALGRLGWTGWRAEVQQGPSGQCGLFEGTGSSFSDPTASIDAQHHVVWIVAGPLPSLLALTGPLDLSLLQASGRSCYTTAQAESVVRGAFAGVGASIQFALTQQPSGTQVEYAQSSYDRGCTIVSTLWPASVGATIDVWLNAKSGPPAPAGGNPPSINSETLSAPRPTHR